MESFTKELVSNASAQLFPDKIFSSSTNLLPEQLHLEVNGKLQCQKYCSHQRTKTSRRENVCFLTKYFESRQNSTIWNLIFTLPLGILLKP